MSIMMIRCDNGEASDDRILGMSLWMIMTKDEGNDDVVNEDEHDDDEVGSLVVDRAIARASYICAALCRPRPQKHEVRPTPRAKLCRTSPTHLRHNAGAS